MKRYDLYDHEKAERDKKILQAQLDLISERCNCNLLPYMHIILQFEKLENIYKNHTKYHLKAKMTVYGPFLI